MPFIRYSEKNRSLTAKASLSVSGMLSFSHGACQRFDVGRYTHAVLYFDPDTQRVGVELTTDDKAEGARKLRHRKTGADIGAKSFADFFGIQIEATKVFPLQKDAESGLLVFDLKDGKVRGGTSSSGSTSSGSSSHSQSRKQDATSVAAGQAETT